MWLGKHDTINVQTKDLGRVTGLNVEALCLPCVTSDDGEILPSNSEDGTTVRRVGIEVSGLRRLHRRSVEMGHGGGERHGHCSTGHREEC